MIRRALLILPAALLCLGFQAAPKAPAAKAPAPKAAAARAAPFDAQNPQSLMDLLGEAGAKVQTRNRDADSVFVTVESTAANFSLQFAGCTPQGRSCRAVLLDGPLARTAVTGAQVNAFNQTSVMCRLYQDRAGVPHALYSALLFKSMSRADATDHLVAWQNCLVDSLDFLKDPVGYLANAA